MKILTIHIDDDLDAELTSAAKSTDSRRSKSQFVRQAVREKIDRDAYGVVSVPTPQTIRQNMVPAVAAVSNGVTTKSVGDDGLTEGQRRFREMKARGL